MNRDKSGVSELRMTNTLSYSETVWPHTASGFGRKTMISETNTVFGGGTSKFSNNQEIGLEELQASARFGAMDDFNG